MPSTSPISAAALLLALAALPGCKGKDANAEANRADSTGSGSDSSGMALPVAGQEVRQGDLILSVVTTGQVRSDAFSKLKSETIIERDGRPLVFVVKNSRAQWVYIQPGLTNGSETEVLPDSTTGQIPLTPGDTT